LLERRWEAAAAVRAAGLPVGICVTPMLPLENPVALARRLMAFRPDVLVVGDFHDSHGGFGADTGEVARRLLRERGWTVDTYRACVEQLKQDLPVFEGEAGFFPPGSSPRA
jgi:hypothetical protein